MARVSDILPAKTVPVDHNKCLIETTAGLPELYLILDHLALYSSSWEDLGMVECYMELWSCDSTHLYSLTKYSVTLG